MLEGFVLQAMGSANNRELSSGSCRFQGPYLIAIGDWRQPSTPLAASRTPNNINDVTTSFSDMISVISPTRDSPGKFPRETEFFARNSPDSLFRTISD